MGYVAAMRRYRRGSHTVYELHFHFVFTTKYRKPVLRGDVGTRLRDLIREICKTKDIEISSGVMSGLITCTCT